MKKIPTNSKTNLGGGYTLIRNTRAFTLIELLVVIAIIGILAGVVIASLNSARDKSKFTAIKSSLKNIGLQAELYFFEHQTYEGLCEDTQISNMLTVLDSGGIRYFCYVMPDSHQKNLNFAVSANLKGKNFSVDNRGVVEVLGTHGSGVLSYNDAINTCASMGARMMGVEQLKALHASYGTDNVSGFTAAYHNTFTVVKGVDTFSNFYIHMEKTGPYPGAISYNNFSAIFACGK